MTEDTYVLLPNGFSINKRFLQFIYAKLVALREERGVRFWELVVFAQNPSRKISADSKKDLFTRGLLGDTDHLHYTNQMAILFLVEGHDPKFNIISSEDFEKLISPRTP